MTCKQCPQLLVGLPVAIPFKAFDFENVKEEVANAIRSLCIRPF
jgi:hypothetical protein